MPPYVIFHDATLVAMVQQKPGTALERLELNGVGKTKLDKYGERFLGAIRDAIAGVTSDSGLDI